MEPTLRDQSDRGRMGASAFLGTVVPMTRRITPRQLTSALVKSAAWAGLTLIDPNKQFGWRKHAYWLGTAAATGAEVARPLPGDEPRPTGLGLGIGLGTAGVTYGAHELLARGDAWSMDFLRRFGLKHPRAWAAAAVFVGGLAAALTEARVAEPEFEDVDEEMPARETLEPLPEGARRIIEKLLTAVDGYGSAELLEQLDDVVCRPESGNHLLLADPESPRTLLESYTYPASAIFTRDGINHVLMLDIEEGRLSYLSHYVEPWQEDESTVDWSLPSVDELKVVVGFDEAAEAQ